MNRLDTHYFERVYRDDPDPWGFETRWYERRKYSVTLAALPQARYGRVFEPGCSSGVLSERLAERCDALICSELVPSIAARARRRLRGFDHVSVTTLPIPEHWPVGRFDLIVLSELVYYLEVSGVNELLARIDQSTDPGAHVLLVHYRGPTDYPLTGDRCHALFRAHANLRRLSHYEEQSFMLDVFERVTR